MKILVYGRPPLPGVLREADLAPYLLRSFTDWIPDDDPENPREVLIAKRNAAHIRLLAGGDRPSVSEMLNAVADSDQADWAVSTALEKHGTRLIAHDLGCWIARSFRQLAERPAGEALDVEVTVFLRSLVLPSSGHDEVQLELRVFSGAEPTALANFMASNHMVPEGDQTERVERWCKYDTLIGNTEEERAALEKALGINLGACSEENVHFIKYNYGLMSGRIWRECESVVRVAAPLDFDHYPFDRSILTLRLYGSVDFDAADRIMRPQPDTASVAIDSTASPRGFVITGASRDLQPFVEQSTPDTTAESLLLMVLEISRRPESFVWRTFVPTTVVLLLALLAAVAAMVLNRSIEAVMTSVVPGVLLACVALQLTAAQNVPPAAGRTYIDELYVYAYVHLLLLYVSLLLVPSVTAWVALGVAGAVFIVGGARILAAVRRRGTIRTKSQM